MKTSQFKLASALVALALTACTTTQKTTETAPPPPVPTPVLSMNELQSSLGMDRSPTELGYEERTFDSCNTRYTENENCGHRQLVVIHLRMQCRDSTGTVSEVNRIQPIASKNVKWNLGALEGTVTTDDEGYGQIRTVASVSPRNQRLRLTIAKKYLGLTASEAQRIVTPGDWCGRR